MTNKFLLEDDNLEIVMNIYREDFTIHANSTSVEFLALDPKKFHAENELPNEKERENYKYLFFLLRNIYFSKYPYVWYHFDSFGFPCKASDLFLNFDEIMDEFIKIRNRKIIFVDFINTMEFIIQYHELKMYHLILDDPANNIVYKDRIKSQAKWEMDNFYKKNRSGKISISDQQLMKKMEHRTPNAPATRDWINHLGDRFDAFVFRKGFNKLFEPIDKRMGERVYLLELYQLFKIITKSKKFITEEDYQRQKGYDSFEHYQYVLLKRLFYARN